MTGEQLNLDDIELSLKQHQTRPQNHIPSACSKAPKGQHALHIDAQLGDLVYLKYDGSKHESRE